MIISKKQIAIFYIEKNKAIFFSTDVDKPLMVSFPQTLVNNLEVVDRSKMEQLITNCITKNEIKPTNIFILLSKDILFEKEIKEGSLSEQNHEVEKFLEMVPIHHILSKSYNFSNKTIIVAADNDFCISIVNAFKENSFPVMGILPLSIFEEKFPILKENFDEKLALQKIENLKKYSLPLEIDQEEKIITNDVPPIKNMKFISLIGLFILLLTFLGVQIYMQFLSPPVKPQPVKHFEVIKADVTPIASTSATIAPTRTSAF